MEVPASRTPETVPSGTAPPSTLPAPREHTACDPARVDGHGAWRPPLRGLQHAGPGAPGPPGGPSAQGRRGRVPCWAPPGGPGRAHQDGTGGAREPKCGSGLAATPTSCNHLQPLECTGETREIYLFIVGICGQWVFLMKTICFCVFPENIIP